MSFYRTREEDIKFFNELAKLRHYCKHCGHSLYIANKRDIVECSYCHNLVFKNDKAEFMYRMKENLIREKRNNK